MKGTAAAALPREEQERRKIMIKRIERRRVRFNAIRSRGAGDARIMILKGEGELFRFSNVRARDERVGIQKDNSKFYFLKWEVNDWSTNNVSTSQIDFFVKVTFRLLLYHRSFVMTENTMEIFERGGEARFGTGNYTSARNVFFFVWFSILVEHLTLRNVVGSVVDNNVTGKYFPKVENKNFGPQIEYKSLLGLPRCGQLWLYS